MAGGHKTVILSDSASGSARIRRALRLSADVSVVDTVSRGPEILTSLRSLEPDVVIVDGAWGSKADVEFIRSVAAVLPRSLIMLVAPDEDLEYVQQALLAGARGFVTQSSAESSLVEALDRMLQLETFRRPLQVEDEQGRVVADGKEGRLISVFSAKGGVGCTVIAVNLAIALRRQTGEAVCLFDCDLHFGNVAVLLNLWPQTTLAELLPYTDDLTPELVEEVMLTHPSGVRVLLPPTAFEDAEKVGSSLVARVVQILKRRQKFVIVDVGARLDSSALAILDSSFRIVLVTTPEVPALHNLRRMLQLTEDLGYPREKVVILGNRFSASWGVQTTHIAETLGYPVAVTLPSDGRLVTQAANRGIPFVVDAPRSAPARAVSELADLIVEADRHGDIPESPPARSRWLLS
jgi:pilus assembly protein CpaE